MTPRDLRFEIDKYVWYVVHRQTYMRLRQRQRKVTDLCKVFDDIQNGVKGARAVRYAYSADTYSYIYE